jgi:hypothetical protein
VHGITRELVLTFARPLSRAGDDLGLARLPWPSLGAGDALELDDGRVVRVLDVVTAPAGSQIDALVSIAPSPA